MEKKAPVEKEQRAMRPVFLTTASDQIEAEMLKAVLEQNQIYVLEKDPASGGYMRVYMGFSIYGQDLYVDEVQYAAAKQLLDEFYSVDGEAILDGMSDSFLEETDPLSLNLIVQDQETTAEEQAAHKMLTTLIFLAGAALLVLIGVSLF